MRRCIRKIAISSASFASLFLAAQSADAVVIPYPNSRTVNGDSYSFTAMATGTVVPYFARSTASYDESVSMTVNGVPTGIADNDVPKPAVLGLLLMNLLGLGAAFLGARRRKGRSHNVD